MRIGRTPALAQDRTGETPSGNEVIGPTVGQAPLVRPIARTPTLSATGLAVMALGAGVWTAVVAALAIRRHQGFLSHRFDLGNMVQAVWSTAHGRPLEMTDGATGVT